MIHTNVYGTARSTLALGTLLTLVFGSDDTLFTTNGFNAAPSALRDFLLFGMFREQLFVARLIAYAVLLLVVVGYRPRLTALAHWWVSFSFVQGCVVPDGGDQITALLSLLLVPVALTDGRRNHFDVPLAVSTTGRTIAHEVAKASLHVIRFQVALVYAYSAVAKMGVAEWGNGTAIYYWLQDPSIGLAKSTHGALFAVLGQPLFVVGLTWIPIALMVVLAMTLTMPASARRHLIWPAIAFHAGNMMCFGLCSFFVAMCAADVLLLTPLDQPIMLGQLRSKVAAACSAVVRRRQYETVVE